jgi:hypothetical protein
MSNDERARNRAKQARFRQRHRTRLARERQAAADSSDGPPRGVRPGHRCIELVWPTGSAFSGLPMAVIVLRNGQHWRSYGPLAGWIRELAAVGLEPVESFTFVPRVVMGLRTCLRVRDARIAAVAAWSGGKPPVWLLES